MSKLIPLKLYGSNRDKEPSELPNDIYSSLNNVRFNDGATEKITGYTQIFGTLSDNPLRLQNYVTPLLSYWMYGGINGMFVTDGTNHYNITPASGATTTTIANRWNTTYLNGVPIFNNKENAPIWWNGAPASIMTDITGWPAGYKCDVIRSFKNFLFALNMEEGGTRYAQKYRWSDAAAPGSLPSAWTPTDTNDAGSGTLSETKDVIIDGLPLKDSFIIYKQNSTYAIQYIGGRYIFKDDLLFGSFGALAEGCVIEFDNKHAVLSTNDFIVHNGNTYKSVIDERWRNYLFSQINSEYNDTCYLAHKQNDDEIWICYPSGSSQLPNKAVVWNYREDQFYHRDIPASYDSTIGVVVPSGVSDTWASDSNSWESDTTSWDEKLYTATSDSLLIAGYTNDLIYHSDDSETFNGTPIIQYLERLSMPIINNSHVKLISRLWPSIIGSSGAQIVIQIGVQDRPNNPVSWGPARTYTVGTDKHVDFFVEGRYISIRIYTLTELSWKLYDLLIEAELKGVY